MSIYAATAQRTLATIKKKGAPVVFTSGAPVYDAATDTWTAGTSGSIPGHAVQGTDDPARFAALNLTLVDPVTLLVAAEGLASEPEPGMMMLWSGKTYVVKNVETVAPAGTVPPDGVPILHVVIGSR